MAKLWCGQDKSMCVFSIPYKITPQNPVHRLMLQNRIPGHDRDTLETERAKTGIPVIYSTVGHDVMRMSPCYPTASFLLVTFMQLAF